MEIRVAENPGAELQCALCHEGLPKLSTCCEDCGTRMHFGCRVSLVRCPTLGCPSLPHEQIVSAPQSLLRESRRASKRRVVHVRLARVAGLVVLGGLAIAVSLGLSPYVQRQVTHVRRDRAQADLSFVAAALGLYRHDTGRSPGALDDLHTQPTGVSGWRGPYIDDGPLLDPWGNAYVYWRRSGRVYELLSYGADGVPGGHGPGRDLRHWP